MNKIYVIVKQFIVGSRLRNKFALMFLVFASVPVLILGGIALFLIDISHRYDVSNLELQAIDQKIEEIEKFFADTLGILQLRVAFSQKSEIELSQQYFLLDGFLEENRAFEEVSFINILGKETAKKQRNVAETELFDVSFLPKFKQALSGKNFIGDVSHTLAGPIVTIAAPVHNRNGDIIEILSAEVRLDSITRALKTSRIGTAGHLFLFDRNGAMISDPSIGEAFWGIDFSRVLRISRVLNGEIFDALGPTDRYESIIIDTPVVGAGKRVNVSGWALLAEWPLSDADAIIHDIRNQVMLLTLASILGVLLLSPLFASRLLKPIRTLKDGTASIAEGKFQTRVAIETGDELEDLGNSFNIMAQGLKRLQELRDEFVFIAAHELRNPVTIIRGYLSFVMQGRGGKISPKAKEFLKQVDDASRGLAELVNDLLKVAREDAGRIEIKVSSVDIRRQVEKTIQQFKPAADEKSLILTYSPDPQTPEVLADEILVKEVLDNFISNAIKYISPRGTIWILHEVVDGELITHVKDNGPGISEEAQKRLFEKFYRVKTEETRKITGTGLGLFIVKQLVERMKGRIFVKSAEGKGSTFSFSLPISHA